MPLKLRRLGPTLTVVLTAPVTTPAEASPIAPRLPAAESLVAEVVEIEDDITVTLVLAAGVNAPIADTSQSPAVRDMLVMFVSVLVVMPTDAPLSTAEEISSPTSPAFALLLVVTPSVGPLKLVLAMNLVAVRVSVAKARSASSARSPAVDTRGTRPEVSPESVTDVALRDVNAPASGVAVPMVTLLS